MGKDISKHVESLVRWSQGKLAYFVGLIVLIGLLVGAGWAYQKHLEEFRLEASNALYQAQTLYEEAFPQIKAHAEDPSKPSERHLSEIESPYKNIIDSYPGTLQAQVATLDLSRIYFDLKKYDTSVEILKKSDFSKATRFLYYFRLATAHEGLKKFDEASKTWKALTLDNQVESSFHGIAKLQLARLSYMGNRKESAQKLLDEISKEYQGQFEAEQADKLKLFFEK